MFRARRLWCLALVGMPVGACHQDGSPGADALDAAPWLLGDARAMDAVPRQDARPLVDPAKWTLVDLGGDPFAAERSGRTPCGPSDFREELGTVEIETRACDYITLTQPALVDAGDREVIALTVWWQDLALLQPAVAHLALAIGTTIAWQAQVPIPGKAEYHELGLRLSRAITRGEPVFVHVRNHGMNNWHFGPITVGAAGVTDSR